MKLLVDMNLSPRWVERLNDSRLEAIHWSSIGNVKAPDDEIMAHASEHDYVVLTSDLDFSGILAITHGEKPSVVQIRSGNLDPDFIGPQVIRAVQRLRSELAAGALLTVEPASTRVRLLPLSRENSTAFSSGPTNQGAEDT